MRRYILNDVSPVSSDVQEFPLLDNGASENGCLCQGVFWPGTVRFNNGECAPLFIGGILKSAEIFTIAQKIAQEIADCFCSQKLLFLQILEGAAPFCRLVCDNLQSLSLSDAFTYDVAQLKVNSYLDGSQARQHQVSLPLQHISGKQITTLEAYDRVIVFDDLIDAGQTCAWLLSEYLPPYDPKQISAYFMLEKSRKRTPEVEETLKDVGAVCGKRVPNEWVVGYGLDIRLPGKAGQPPLHLFRGPLPGGIYAFNSRIEKQLLAEYQAHPHELQRQLAVIASSA